jgi:multisubunit Na+/H+ antiporter MnhG subunit
MFVIEFDLIIRFLSGLISGIGLFSAIISIYGVNFYGKDLYQKAHCAGISDSFAMPLIISGTCLSSLNSIIIFKSIFLIAFILITCATSCHCLCNLVYISDKESKDNLIK